MIVLDLNLLIYAYNTGAPEHDRARPGFENALSGSETIGMDWAVVKGFLRLMTKGPHLASPFTPREAVDIVNHWFSSAAIELLVPGPRYWPILQDLLISGNIRGALVSDAHLAAVAIEHDATFCTTE